MLVIRRHPKTAENQQDLLRWSLIPNWIKEANPKTKPMNATAERVATACKAVRVSPSGNAWTHAAADVSSGA